jgi:hypothetical protein
MVGGGRSVAVGAKLLHVFSGLYRRGESAPVTHPDDVHEWLTTGVLAGLRGASVSTIDLASGGTMSILSPC